MIPDDLVPLREVAAKLPGKSEVMLRAMSRRKAFPDLFMVGNVAFVRAADLEVWSRGCWESHRVAMAEARFRHALPDLKNRRAKERA